MMAGNMWTGGPLPTAQQPAPQTGQRPAVQPQQSGPGSDSWMRDRLMAASIQQGNPGYFYQQPGNYQIISSSGRQAPQGLLDINAMYGGGASGAGAGGGAGGGLMSLANTSPSPWAPIENQVIANRLGWNDLSKLGTKK